MGTKMIIDCDTGIDDAQAIIMAVTHDNIDVKAVTCVNGNASIDNVCRNTLRVLHTCQKSQVPVYKGCITSLTGEVLMAQHVHGGDGLGDVKHFPEIDMTNLQKEHASLAIIRLTNQYPGEITMVAMGPLTNLAVAIRIDPDVSSRIKRLFIMGGNIEGKGNTSPAAEFNFRVDPEAACIVLNEFRCPITIIPWEACLSAGFTWDWVEQKWINTDTPKGNFIRDITATIRNFYKNDMRRSLYTSCDAVAMAVAIDYSVATDTQDVYATVELAGTYTKGQMICDWRKKLGKPPNVCVVLKYHHEKVQDLLKGMLM
ncbi:hypothetical protein FSP39_002518 [Pinctada imbricata]|uniref:Inosine/uridine-preferring nucleoside hydrolase domain-containing protein n=1 Tax=Pinctada imbricata TaxID=66713 RepID=A0AA88Y770_PINIB|nr:hypothetical protein FSP39_002518 [Pinctada imbricata]